MDGEEFGVPHSNQRGLDVAERHGPVPKLLLAYLLLCQVCSIMRVLPNFVPNYVQGRQLCAHNRIILRSLLLSSAGWEVTGSSICGHGAVRHQLCRCLRVDTIQR